MTMLIAGHETTAAVLTWALFCLVQHPQQLQPILQEVDSNLGDDTCGRAAPERVLQADGMPGEQSCRLAQKKARASCRWFALC